MFGYRVVGIRLDQGVQSLPESEGTQERRSSSRIDLRKVGYKEVELGNKSLSPIGLLYLQAVLRCPTIESSGLSMSQVRH